jgi:hypothetical protein
VGPSFRALPLVGLLAIAGCEYWSLSVNQDGLVLISVIGDDNGRNRFRVRSRHSDGSVQVLDVPSSGHLTLRSVADGMLELTLLPPAGCRVVGGNPHNLNVSDGQDLSVDFDVRC